jgi:hypothetical protein
VLPGTVVLTSLGFAVYLGRRPPRLLVSLVVISAGLGAAWLFVRAGHIPAVVVWVAQVGTAVAGWFFGVAIGAGCAGTERFSLPFDQMMLVTLLVGGLAPWFGWEAVAWVVGVYLALAIILGLAERLGA